MSIRSTLKKEGISVIGQLNTFEVNKIASNISEKICKAFPEHNINQSDLFISISRLNMYIADMTKDRALAKYFFKNNSIYFNKSIDFNNLGTLAIHECIHFMQELRNKNGKLIRFGLYDMEGKNHGMAINEASVQLMASIANGEPLDTVKYYNLELTTESPDYYPIETALLRQLIYFTGSYPLFHSTLNSNDVFRNTFIEKSNAKTYNKIESNMDLIMHYEEKLNSTSTKLAYLSEDANNHIAKLKKLNGEINALKELIFNITLETQNTILVECFNKQFENIRTLNDIKKFQSDLYNFKTVTINTGNYNFYNEYYCDMMTKLDEKREFLEKYGDILTYESLNKELSLIEEDGFGFQFFKKLFNKLSLLTEEFFRAKEY